jgi:hypothetical protein
MEAESRARLLNSRLALVKTRIKRSLKPKRLALISAALNPLVHEFSEADIGAALLLDGGAPYGLDGPEANTAKERLRRDLQR